MIEFHAVHKAWGSNVVLNGLDFQVGHGEKVTIIGPSGSGKTTILRTLMTLERPDSGAVLVEGETLWPVQGSRRSGGRAQDAIRRKVGMVFQHFNLFPHLSVLDNIIEAPVNVLGLSKEQARAEAADLLERVGLSDHANHRPYQMSGGQQQRAAIARALAMRPRVLLFDEPTSALDPEMVGGVLDVIREVADSNAITMLLVTHEMRFASEISDRVVMFDSGAVVEQGSPEQVFHHPTQERTQRFLSAVNVA
ncbi:amino acid ABC transporter ATP-binding protein [Acidipropionibacterium jensenii]|uniref:Amino acid ABC transporter ATP-binding protein n=1 Tax=Acidipropionibacterium jensenii TaxID=1749 RepID=A0A3Q9UJF5_9ACTN|nr:amino acid ABC transporter ATP-binding protein [Acidipropionibacterium jensenii]AZZ38557.1 amino acid ABC transporter ATP-binding protein [Acidipropionibacterium jensenii]